VRRAFVRSCTWLLFGGLPLLLVAFYSLNLLGRGLGHSDFGTFWLAGRAVLHGHSPYPTIQSLPAHASKTFAPFVYPPVAAFLMVPLAALPLTAAKIAYLLVQLGALALALRLLGVGDWRCYGLAFACPQVVESTAIGTISLPLLLAVAAAWRYRERVVACGLLVASVVTAKLFLWPVWFWLVRTRRYRAAALAVGFSLVAVVAAWAAIGFAGLRDYPTLLARMTGLEGPHSYSVYALQRTFGLGDGPAGSATWALGVIALAVALRFLRDDRRSLMAMIGVSFVATPILWPHYLVLLFVPVALAAPVLSPLWLAPLALWVDTTAWSHGSPLRIAGELTIAAVAVGAAIHRSLPPGQRAAVGTTRLRSSECLQPTGATSSVL
jgi:alpha-1,2-mannosyltransferase